MPPADFWRVTPRIFQVTINALHRAAIARENTSIANAYYSQAFARTKRLKPLNEYLLSPDGAPKGATIQTPEDMLTVLRELEAGGAAMKFEFIPNDPGEGAA